MTSDFWSVYRSGVEEEEEKEEEYGFAFSVRRVVLQGS